MSNFCSNLQKLYKLEISIHNENIKILTNLIIIITSIWNLVVFCCVMNIVYVGGHQLILLKGHIKDLKMFRGPYNF